MGLFLFSCVYLGMAFAASTPIFLFLFLLYGIYAAATEGVAKAWISNICDKKDTATAIGTYTAFQSVLTLVASSMTGIIWATLGASTAFLITASMTFLVMLYLLFVFKE